MAGKLRALCCTPCCDEFIQHFLKCDRWLQTWAQNEADSLPMQAGGKRRNSPHSERSSLLCGLKLFSDLFNRCIWGKYQSNGMWMHRCIRKALLSCHMCKAMRWKKGTSLAHKTYYSLDLGFQISAEVQTMSQERLASQQDQQQNEACFSCHRRLMGGFPLSNPACFCCLLIKT